MQTVREHLPGSHINMNMQIRLFFNTLVFVSVFTVSGFSQANYEEFRIFQVELLDTALIQDNYEHFDSVQVSKPIHSQPLPCEPTCNHKRVPGIIKGSTMKDIIETVQHITDFINSKFE